MPRPQSNPELIYNGFNEFPWTPKDDWVGPGYDYPPPGTRAIAVEMHSTRIKVGAHVADWQEWEKRPIEEIRRENLLARIKNGDFNDRLLGKIDVIQQ